MGAIDIRESLGAVVAVRDDFMVKRSVASNRLTFLRFEEWSRDEAGVRTGVFMLVDEQPEHADLVKAVSL